MDYRLLGFIIKSISQRNHIMMNQNIYFPDTFRRRLRKDECYLQFVTVIRDCNLIFFAVQMCFKRGDISNLMEKLVG